LMIYLQPEIAAGMRIGKVTMNTVPVLIETATSKGVLKDPIPFFVKKTATLRLEHKGGFGVLPVRARPSVGDSSLGYRCISSSLAAASPELSDEQRAKTFVMTFEGAQGTQHEFEVMVFDQTPASVDGASMSNPDANGRMKLTVSFEQSDRPYVAKSVVLRMK
jgi:hypothetical protein